MEERRVYFNTDEEAIDYLKSKTRQGQWVLIANALKTIENFSGHGEIVLHISDGYIGDHPRFEVSL